MRRLFGRRPRRLVAIIGQHVASAQEAEQRRLQQADYGPSPMPQACYELRPGELGLVNPSRLPLDSELAELSHRFARSEPDARARMRRSISMDEFYTLLAFSRRAAVFAIRDGRVEHVVDGLTAIAMIDSERVDFRDILGALSLLHHAVIRVGHDPHGLFRDATALAGPDVAKPRVGQGRLDGPFRTAHHRCRLRDRRARRSRSSQRPASDGAGVSRPRPPRRLGRRATCPRRSRPRVRTIAASAWHAALDPL